MSSVKKGQRSETETLNKLPVFGTKPDQPSAIKQNSPMKVLKILSYLIQVETENLLKKETKILEKLEEKRKGTNDSLALQDIDLAIEASKSKILEYKQKFEGSEDIKKESITNDKFCFDDGKQRNRSYTTDKVLNSKSDTHNSMFELTRNVNKLKLKKEELLLKKELKILGNAASQKSHETDQDLTIKSIDIYIDYMKSSKIISPKELSLTYKLIDEEGSILVENNITSKKKDKFDCDSVLYFFGHEHQGLLVYSDNQMFINFELHTINHKQWVAWSQLKIWNEKQELEEGLWSLHVAVPPVKPKLNLDQQNIVSDSFVYLRVFNSGQRNDKMSGAFIPPSDYNLKFQVGSSGSIEQGKAAMNFNVSMKPQVSSEKSLKASSIINRRLDENKMSLFFFSTKDLSDFAKPDNSKNEYSLSQNFLPPEELHKKIDLVVSLEKLLSFYLYCPVIRVCIIEETNGIQNKIILTDTLAKLNKQTLQLKEKVEFKVSMIAQVSTFVQLEFCDESKESFGWTRFFPFSLDLASNNVLLNDSLKECILYKSPVNMDYMIPLGGACVWIRAIHVDGMRNLDLGTINAKYDLPKEIWCDCRSTIDLDNLFEEHTGFTIFIDGARFLPANTTFTKVLGCVVDGNFELFWKNPILETDFDLNTDCGNPIFMYQKTFDRLDTIDFTSTIVFVIFCFDKNKGKVFNLGFSMMPLFIDSSTHSQPVMSSSGVCHLNRGCFQLPIYIGKLNKNDFVSMRILKKYKRLSCATLLIRLTSNLEKSDDFPLYSDGVYNSMMCLPSEKEIMIYKQLAQNTHETQNYKDLLLAMGKIASNDDESRAIMYLNHFFRNATFDKYFKIHDIDYTFVCKYDDDIGFKVSVDSFQNLPKLNRLTLGILSICPPAVLYDSLHRDKFGTNNTRCTSQPDFESSIRSPEFLDGFWSFRAEFNTKFWIVIGIRKINVNSQQHLEEVGWCAMPIFNKEGYVKHGCYQLPLFHGSPTRNMILQLYSRNPTTVLQNMVNEGQVRYIEGSSIIIRICDGRRDNELGFDRDSTNKEYLPQNLIEKYTKVISSEKLQSAVPRNVSPPKFLLYALSEIKNALFNFETSVA